MWFLHTMGCGWSKHNSGNGNEEETKSEGKSKKGVRKRQNNDKSSKQDNKKEKQDSISKDSVPNNTKPVINSRTSADSNKENVDYSNKTVKDNVLEVPITPLSLSNGGTQKISLPTSSLIDYKSPKRVPKRDQKFGASNYSKITDSQADFFRLLDEKIEKGNDYDDPPDDT